MNAQGYFEIDDMGRVDVHLREVINNNGETVQKCGRIFEEAVGLLERHVEENADWLFHQYGGEGRIELNGHHVSVRRLM